MHPWSQIFYHRLNSLSVVASHVRNVTSSNENFFRVTGPLCGEYTGHRGEFPTQRPVTWSFDVLFDIRLNKWMNKQSWGWWSETPSCSLWRHCNDQSERQNHTYTTYVTSSCISWYSNHEGWDAKYIMHPDTTKCPHEYIPLQILEALKQGNEVWSSVTMFIRWKFLKLLKFLGW